MLQELVIVRNVLGLSLYTSFCLYTSINKTLCALKKKENKIFFTCDELLRKELSLAIVERVLTSAIASNHRITPQTHCGRGR